MEIHHQTFKCSEYTAFSEHITHSSKPQFTFWNTMHFLKTLYAFRQHNTLFEFKINFLKTQCTFSKHNTFFKQQHTFWKHNRLSKHTSSVVMEIYHLHCDSNVSSVCFIFEFLLKSQRCTILSLTNWTRLCIINFVPVYANIDYLDMAYEIDK